MNYEKEVVTDTEAQISQRNYMEVLQNIPFELDTESLGAKLHLQKGSDDAKELDALVETIRPHIRPKAVYIESYIEARGEDTVTIDGVTFTSRVLRANLESVERVFPFIATCGRGIDELDLTSGDFIKQFWIDTIKETALRSMVTYLNEHVNRRYALKKSSSMSPGSGDVGTWTIEQQKNLFTLFGNVSELIGVELTDSFLMIPNKSVSGIRFPTEIDFRTCQVCHRENCSSRSAPFDSSLWETYQHNGKDIT